VELKYLLSIFLFSQITGCGSDSSSDRTIEENLYGSWISECVESEVEEGIYNQYVATFTEEIYTTHYRDYSDESCVYLNYDWGPTSLNFSENGYTESNEGLEVLKIDLTSESYNYYSIVYIDGDGLLWLGDESESSEGLDGSTVQKRTDGLTVTEPYRKI